MFIKASLENLITSHHLKSSKRIGGSASIVLSVDSLPIKKINVENIKCNNNSKITAVVKIDFNDFVAGEIIKFDSIDFNYFFEMGYIERYRSAFRLNKNKVRNKILAYAHLRRSKKFMAFYSISFPLGLKDDDIRKIHNVCLTRIRKFRKSFTYIWIAERQKNGTLHFHMLTNDYFNIRMINRYYAVAIMNHIKKNNLSDINYDVTKYNGVDVKLVRSIESLSKYLTKYVTKNNESFEGLVWNCDSSVSALITHIYLDDFEYKTINKKLIHVFTIKRENPYFDTPLEIDLWSYGSNKPALIFETIKEINEYIVKFIV